MRSKNKKIHSTLPPTVADSDVSPIEERKMAREQRRRTSNNPDATAVVAPASGTAGHAAHRGGASLDHKPEIVFVRKKAGLQRFEPALSCGNRGIRTPELIIDRRKCASCLAATEEAQGFDKSSRRSLEGIVAVTSTREIALSIEHVWTLKWTGASMLGTSMLLLTLVLTAWRGIIDPSLALTLSPWLGVYLPIPLGLLNGAWCLQCARRGYILHEGTDSCVSRAGLCGTAWGCSGSSCALNLGLDLAVLITALLATLPAGFSAIGCGYDCYGFLCFPCAPLGGRGIASGMAAAAFGLAVAAGGKMWVMTATLRHAGWGDGVFSFSRKTDDFLPW